MVCLSILNSNIVQLLFWLHLMAVEILDFKYSSTEALFSNVETRVQDLDRGILKFNSIVTELKWIDKFSLSIPWLNVYNKLCR